MKPLNFALGAIAFVPLCLIVFLLMIIAAAIGLINEFVQSLKYHFFLNQEQRQQVDFRRLCNAGLD
jgi:hypothetical protein